MGYVLTVLSVVLAAQHEFATSTAAQHKLVAITDTGAPIRLSLMGERYGAGLKSNKDINKFVVRIAKTLPLFSIHRKKPARILVRRALGD